MSVLAADAELDFSHEAMHRPQLVAPPTDPWLARRMLGFGASDVPALLVGLDLRAPESATDHIRANAKVRLWREGTQPEPRIIAEKAGLKRPLKHGGDNGRESALFRAWVASLGPDSVIDPKTAVHPASTIPRDLLSPIVDVECPRLAVSIDGFALDVLGARVIVELKCADVGAMKAAGPSYLVDGACPWFWRVQVQAQLAATRAELALLVNGEGWAYRDAAPIVVWPIERDEAAIAEIRAACVEGWRRVERLKEGM